MLKWVVVLLVVSIISGVLGYTGIAVTAASMSKNVFFVSIVLFVISAAISIVKKVL